MQIARKRLGAMVLAACLLVALAFGGTLAIAAGEWAPAGPYTLDVYAQSNEKLAADLASGDVDLVADVYQLATGEEDTAYETYNYTLAFPFATEEMQDLFDNALDKDSAGDWEAVGAAAMEILSDPNKAKGATKVGSATLSKDGVASLSFSEKGIFMVVPHGLNDESLVAYGPVYKYEFNPSLLALPTKDAVDGVIGTAAEYGDWLNATAIDLKVEEKLLYGSLTIKKNVTEFRGTPVIFDFSIDSVPGSDPEYHQTKAVELTKGTSAEGLVEGIPAGIEVEVRETYDGAGYERVSDEVVRVKIVSDKAVELGADQATVTFLITTGSSGTFWWGPEKPVRTLAMRSTTSMPSVTLPKTA